MFKDEGLETVEALKTSYCTGCGACKNICPENAIEMVQDNEGYYVPSINQEKCIGCGKCRAVCPVINYEYEGFATPVCYGVMTQDDIREKSTAGGAFYMLADHVLSQGGYVCGAQLKKDLTTEHVIVANKEDLELIRGTKYVQSKVGDVYSEIKKLLDLDKQVLFSGCPCQVAGLRNYLKHVTDRQYDNLLTVDVVCHGAPSQKVFDKYLQDTYGKENVENFIFRTKEYGYSCFNQIAELKDGSRIGSNITADPYEKVMHMSIGHKEICGDCVFAETPRQGDFTVGDFFNAGEFIEGGNDGKGTSTVLLNNIKALKLFEEMKDGLKLAKQVNFSDIVMTNRYGRHMHIPKPERKWLFNCMEDQPFKKVVDYAVQRRFDVGVIGLWYGRNYGSMATYYALHQVLTKKYHLSVFMIENPKKPDGEGQNQVAMDFYDISRRRDLNDMASLNSKCDMFIVGSDQLWNVWLSRPYKQMYFLDFVDENTKKIAYATSFGIEYCGSEEERLISGGDLRRFDHVSVRDDYSKQACEELFDVENVTKVLDPTLICDIEEYRDIEERSSMKDEEDYILAYILDPNPEIGRQLTELSIKKNRKVVVLLDEPPWLFEELNSKLSLSGEGNVTVKRGVGLYEWLWYFDHADAVVTDSFHGTIFSVVYRKPFISLSNARRGAQRFVSLLTPVALVDRLFMESSAILEASDLLDGLDYGETDRLLAELREESLSWLENAIFSTKQVDRNAVYKLIDKRLEK